MTPWNVGGLQTAKIAYPAGGIAALENSWQLSYVRGTLIAVPGTVSRLVTVGVGDGDVAGAEVGAAVGGAVAGVAAGGGAHHLFDRESRRAAGPGVA